MTLNVYSPKELELVACVPTNNCLGDEKKVKAQLASYRMRGEFFDAPLSRVVRVFRAIDESKEGPRRRASRLNKWTEGPIEP